MNIRIHRSPEGADSAGAPAVIEAPEAAVVEKAAPETEGAEKPQEAQAEKPKVTDWDRYQKMQEKYAKRPHAKASKEDLELQRKYEGKDESTIEGYTKGTPDAEEDAPAKPAPKEKPEADPLEPVYKLVGAKSKEDLIPKVEGLTKEVKRLAGINGDVGRVLKEAGVRDLSTLTREIQGSRALHQLVQDLKAGKAEAFAYIGVKGQLPAQEKFTGEIPEGVLDDGLYRHVSPQLKAANDRADALERKLAAIEGKLQPWERSQEQTAATAARTAQKASIITEVSALVDGAEGMWDSKKSGSLAQALNEYYDSPSDAAHNPDLAPILEILAIAREHNLPNLEIALAYWERKNGGSLIAKARADAREPFVGKKPNVGLSDRQGNHNGQFKTFTESHVKEMVSGKRPIPMEWKDANGTLMPDQVPAHLRAIVLGEE